MSLSEPLLRVLAKLSSDRMLIYDTSLPQGFGSLFYLLSQESHSVTWAVAGFLVILVQALLIVGLLLQRAQTFHVAAPRSNADRPLARCSGPEQDRTQEATENIGGRLIEAQEEERSRIARDLHDDICQRLALLSMELEQVSLESIDSNGWINPKVEEIRQHCSDIATDVQAISHQLHSSKLEYLGVVPALRSLCREFCQQHDVNVVFTDEDVPDFLPRDISLSLFRITQEALHNAQKHSGVNHFSVALRGTPDEIQLEISDKGVGFDVEEAERNEGLGLVSMQERVHLLHGLFAIDSKVNCGTRIRVCVPLVAAMKVSTAARTRTPA
ncbi:MAG: sensor histidine kinase [Terracidiphilus sp.]